MNRLTLAIVLTAVWTACGGTPGDRDASDDEAAIRELIRRTAAANNAADTVGWVALFEDGAVYMAPGMPAVTGRADLLDVAAAGFGPYAAAVEITPIEIAIINDWAFARSQVTGTVTPRAGGEAIPVDVKQLVLYHRQPDGSWRIARLIMNSNS